MGYRFSIFLIYISRSKNTQQKSKSMPGAGLEPARSYPRGILSPLCLPIPPPGPGRGAKMEAGLEAKMPANITGKGPLTSNHSVNLSRKAARLQDSRRSFPFEWRVCEIRRRPTAGKARNRHQAHSSRHGADHCLASRLWDSLPNVS